MEITSENYFSKEALNEYLSVSQYKEFAGTLGKKGCESMAMAKLRGECEQKITPALLIGSYVDAHFEGTLDVFRAQHSAEILKKDGGLKADYLRADEIINRIERDPYFMRFMSGRKQVIMTSEFFGATWKCKIDSLVNECITDLKVMKSLTDTFWVKDHGKMTFAHYWGYDIQGAIYQKIVEDNIGKKLPFYIAAASKEKVTDIEIIWFAQKDLDNTIGPIEENIPRILDLKAGKVEPDRCGSCDYCKFTKVLTRPIHFSELIERI